MQGKDLKGKIGLMDRYRIGIGSDRYKIGIKFPRARFLHPRPDLKQATVATCVPAPVRCTYPRPDL
eukprot:169779-Chlamydomonas_euryale.AAC.2